LPQPQVSQHLERDIDDKVLLGVSSGLAAYFAVDTVLVRVGFVITALLTSGAMIIVIRRRIARGGASIFAICSDSLAISSKPR